MNWMDKIISHIIQMNSNPQSLNSRVSDIRASDSKISEASNTWVSEASDSRVSEVSTRVLGLRSFCLGFKTWSQRLGDQDVLGLLLSWALTWACELLGLTKVDT